MYRQTIQKRMGTNLIIVIFTHLIMIASDIISRNQLYSLKGTSLIVNISSIDNINVTLPELLLPTLLQVCCQMFILYIAVWQFICCQSSQYMKGFWFGLNSYFSKAVFILYSSILNWNRVKFNYWNNHIINVYDNLSQIPV